MTKILTILIIGVKCKKIANVNFCNYISFVLDHKDFFVALIKMYSITIIVDCGL